MTTPPRLNEAVFGWSDPTPFHIFTPLTAGPPRDQPAAPIKPRSAYPTTQDWRNHLEHELDAARRRGDRETESIVTSELAKLGPR